MLKNAQKLSFVTLQVMVGKWNIGDLSHSSLDDKYKLKYVLKLIILSMIDALPQNGITNGKSAGFLVLADEKMPENDEKNLAGDR